MRNAILELTQKENIETLSREELIKELEVSKAETFKYINKLLEQEEKWNFINLLLKKMNSIKRKQELCKTVCDGFLRLTNSQLCACSLFNQDNYLVEVKKISCKEEMCIKKNTLEFTDKLDNVCCEFLQNSVSLIEIFEYFESISRDKSIIVPIIYSKVFFGYLLMEKDDKNFYKENINFIQVFSEHIALILENISLYQESEKRNKLKVQFLAGISHEFKTPLSSIIGFAEILSLKNNDKEKNKYINNILQSSRHLLALIQDVLDISRTNYSTLELNYSDFNPKNEITQVIIELDKILKEKNISLDYTLADIKIHADRRRFKQLIYNLISNAVKFNKQGGKIHIFTYIKDKKLFFEITDTGDGISKQNWKKIFEFFSQVNRSQLKRQIGSGIGLAVCKMIVEAHGGEIDFTSRLKLGSTFWFNLPLEHVKQKK